MKPLLISTLLLCGCAAAQELDPNYVKNYGYGVLQPHKSWDRLAIGEETKTCSFMIDHGLHVWLIPEVLPIPGCITVRRTKAGFVAIFSDRDKGRWIIDSTSDILVQDKRVMAYRIEYASK